jgi:hypothetical protein
MPDWFSREEVLVAVARNGQAGLGWAKLALRHASAELKGDREVVLAAVAKSGEALYYASAELKGDREVVLAAMMQYNQPISGRSIAQAGCERWALV